MGDAGVGKTSILLQLSQNLFRRVTTPTIGSGCYVWRVTTTNGPIALQIWDTAGEERYRSFTRLYAQGAVAVIIVYDVTDHQSFENIPVWVSTVRDAADADPFIVIAGNKTDVVPRTVTPDEAGSFCEKAGFEYFEVSAKVGINVGMLFESVAERLSTKVVGDTRTIEGSEGGCC
jgi:small GTP-binding protein